ncbi:unnamed protein product, partial [Musa hybrid cultivar]
LCGRFSHPRRSRVISIFDRFHCLVSLISLRDCGGKHQDVDG